VFFSENRSQLSRSIFRVFDDFRVSEKRPGGRRGRKLIAVAVKNLTAPIAKGDRRFKLSALKRFKPLIRD
jgi:hypothetical protein